MHSLDDGQRAAALVAAVAPPDLIGANRSALGEGDTDLPLPEIWRGRLEGALHDLMEGAGAALEQQLGYTAEHRAALSFTRHPKGLAAPHLRADQRELLAALLDVYLNRLPEDVADEEQAAVEASFDGLHFLWAGGIEPGDAHYYRVQGGPLLIEYDNAARDANHIHTVWRDLDHDFGGDPLAEHYTSGQHKH
ncbi:MAG: DUF3500 domain-containing protein [Actinomycetota bacterium]